MALIEIQKRCDDCEKTRAALAELTSEVRRSILDYENLYHKVRTNLAKLAKHAKVGEEKSADATEADQMAAWRRALIERKLARRSG